MKKAKFSESWIVATLKEQAADVINEAQYEQLLKEIQPQNTGIKVYPNPSHQVFNIVYIGHYDFSSIAVYDATQRKVNAKIIKTGQGSSKSI